MVSIRQSARGISFPYNFHAHISIRDYSLPPKTGRTIDGVPMTYNAVTGDKSTVLPQT